MSTKVEGGQPNWDHHSLAALEEMAGTTGLEPAASAVTVGIHGLSATCVLCGGCQVAERDCRNRSLWVNLWIRVLGEVTPAVAIRPCAAGCRSVGLGACRTRMDRLRDTTCLQHAVRTLFPVA